MRIRLVTFLLPFLVLLPVLPGGAVTITPVYDPGERSARTGFYDDARLTPEQRAEIGPSGNDAETLGEARRNALEHALGLIEAKLGGGTSIGVEVRFSTELDSTPPDITLASAGPCLYGSSLLPRRRTLYPSALAKAIRPNDENLRGSDGPCRGRDMTIRFNDSDNVPFYYGFDEIPADARRFEFVSVVLHETFHGLGFFELVQEDGSWKPITGTDRSGERVDVTLPSIYDEQLYSEADENFLHLLSEESRRAAAVVSEDGLSWYGRTSAGCSYGRLVGNATKFGGTAPDGKPLLHAPSGYQDGTSVSHFHVSVDPDDILEPRFPVATRDMTLALALLKDMGWRVNDPGIPASCESRNGGGGDMPMPTGEPSETPNEQPATPIIDTSAPVNRPDHQPLGPENEGNQRRDQGSSSGGCAVAPDGDSESQVRNMFGGLFLLLSVLALTVAGKKRRAGESRA